MNSLSWSSPTTPLPTEADPRVLFERLFGDGASPSSGVQIFERAAACSTLSPSKWLPFSVGSEPGTARG
jgi:hypothetical protein